MGRIANSWNLAKTSWGVLRSDKTLAALPALSGLASLVALGCFAGLFFLLGFDFGSGDESAAVEPAGYVIAVVAYLVFAFIAVYFQAALVAGANTRLQGGDASVGRSLAAANERIPKLLSWAAVTATVSLILSQLERQGWIGAIVANLLGMAWAIVTFLTVPIIVLENLGPVAALKRSGALFRATWGENLVAQIGFGLFAFLAALPAIAVAGIGIATGVGVVVGLTIAIAVVWLAIVTVVVSALSGIYRTALYRFAVDGQAPAEFTGIDFGTAFRPKRDRR